MKINIIGDQPSGIYYGVSWDENADTYARTGYLSPEATGSSPGNSKLPIQRKMRRCIISDSGVRQYYLNASNSNFKEDGIVASNLDGTDGQVMVEIPKFYYKYGYAGTTHTWEISLYPLSGFTIHPAFVKNGAEVNYRYMGAYEGVLYDMSEARYENGLYLPSDVTYTITFGDNGGDPDTITSDVLTHPFTNLVAGDLVVVSGSAANNGTYTVVSSTDTVITLATGSLAASTANDQCIIQTQRDWTATTGDVLGSVSGFLPITQGTRANFRAAAKNRGTGWRQQDFDLISAIQLLYLVEYASFYSQSMIGNGFTDWSSVNWLAWSNYNPINTTGLTNSLGNATGNLSNGNGMVGSYMSYRGIENFFGHLWKWVDGFNINNNIPYVCNVDTNFADDTTTNYTALGVTMHNADGYVDTLEQQARGFLPASVGASTKITDYYYQSSGWRVARLGGSAYSGAFAGLFCWHLVDGSGSLGRTVAGRLCF
uniref:Uncharacterized protein n=1 Tax=viral metagenome TaxID=1070528 RepID=A0A6M3KJS8_9ZZZZ